MTAHHLIYHALWLGTLCLFSSAAFTLLGAWPVALCLIAVFSLLVTKLLTVNRELRQTQNIALEVKSGLLIVEEDGGLETCYPDPLVYVSVPYQEWQPLKFECVAKRSHTVRFAQALARKDGELLVTVLRDNGVKLSNIYEKDLKVATF